MLRLPLIPAAVLVFASACSFAQQGTSAVERASSLLQQGNYSEARNGFEAVLRSDPANQQARDGEVAASVKLALAERAQSDPKAALTDLLRARALVPDDAGLLLDIGILEDEMQLYHDADETLAAASKLNPGDPQTIYAVAHVKLDLQQLPAAEAGMRTYLQARPDDATAHYGLGRVLQLAQRDSEAEAEFRRSIELQPKQTESYYQLGQLALNAGNFDEALADFDRVLSSNPAHGGALAGAGQARYRQKQYAQAADYLKRAVAAAPDYQPGHYYYGLTLAKLGQKEESERELQLASKMAEDQNNREANRLRLNGPAPK